MSKQTTTFCNRCGQVCLASFSGLEVSFGELLSHFDEAELHLCQDCGARFLDWLKTGKEGPPIGLGATAAPLAGGLCRLPTAKRQRGL
jgi:hypothetical protein